MTEGTIYNYFGFDIEVRDAHNVKMLNLKNIDDPSELQVLLQQGTYYFKIKLNSPDQPIADYTFSTSFEPLDEQVWESGRNLNRSNS